MAITNYDIGGMLARAGESQGQQIAAGATKLGEGVGGLMSGVNEGLQKRQERLDRASTAKEAQELLQKNANDPAQLNALGQKYQTEGKADIAKLFFDSANAAVAKKATQVSALEAGGQDIQKEAQRKRAVQVARQKGDQAALTALNARSLDPVTYLNNQVGKEPQELSQTTETIVEEDPETGKLVANQYRMGYDKVTGVEKSRELIGVDPDQSKAPKDTKKSITEMLVESGVPEDKIDLTTVEGLQLARLLVVDKVQNATLANTLTDMIAEKTPPGVSDAFDILKNIDPGFAQTQTDLANVEKFKALETLSKDNVSGLSALIVRVVNGTTESDVRAVAELDQFKGNKDLLNKWNDFVLNAFQGRLSEDTVQEYGQIMDVLGALAETQQLKTLNSLILSKDPRESEAAIRAKNFLLNGRGQARIVSDS